MSKQNKKLFLDSFPKFNLSRNNLWLSKQKNKSSPQKPNQIEFGLCKKFKKKIN